ncbi:MAG: hypothetical protein LUF04_10355 [Bacteroides sp.]|nr:hypothetical protein [Bacteroides sp.]MCD8080780.1 hypothetical protein [Bacteroides sp.]
MILNQTDYVLERTSDGGYWAFLKVSRFFKGYGITPEEAINNLKRKIDEIVSEMYMVEEYV